MKFLFWTGIILSFVHFSCTPIKESPKYHFSEGIYKVKSSEGKRRAYVRVTGDMVKLYYLSAVGIDTSLFDLILLEESAADSARASYSFSKPSFDIDFLSIPLKFRPSSSSFPVQLNSNLNGAVYLGQRQDVYRIRYKQNQIGLTRYFIDHYGLSFGVFGGLGSTAMNPWVTNNRLSSEYDGAILPLGATVLFAFNSFTSGIALGMDHLMDQNRKIWIYKGRPWVGITLGLNLN